MSLSPDLPGVRLPHNQQLARQARPGLSGRRNGMTLVAWRTDKIEPL
jgi:hypothetical protein